MRVCGNAYGSPATSTTTARITESVIGSCRWNVVPRPSLRGDADGAADLADGVLHHVQPDAAAGELGHDLGRGEARQEQELEQFRLGHLADHVGRGQAAVDDLPAEPLEVDAAAVVGDRDLQHPGPVAGLQPDRAGVAACPRACAVSGGSMP